MKKSKYLVDTSIWIRFFRGKSEIIRNRVVDLLDDERIVINGVVISELFLGARGKKEVQFIKDCISGLDYLDSDQNFFLQCGQLGLQLRKKGINIPLSDLMIATHGKIHKLCIMTTDKHFENIALPLQIEYEILENFQ